MKAQEIMAKNPRCVTPRTSIQEAASLMKSEDVGALPVVESEGSKRLVGMVTDRDIAIRVVADGRDPRSATVSDAMSKGATTAKASDEVDQVMKVMGREQVRRIPIVDERDELVGIVSQADVVLKGASDRKAEDTVERISEPGGKHQS
ncbi:MAG: CBS domain-containing protein [Gemmatimonadaceae bacterium]|nr:CBS domain-containing protein [Gemmatimonadaceae bacterium]NUR17913.1 CBS domain-containing protein [Gemmatimonadaceae bacterium]